MFQKVLHCKEYAKNVDWYNNENNDKYLRILNKDSYIYFKKNIINFFKIFRNY